MKQLLYFFGVASLLFFASETMGMLKEKQKEQSMEELDELADLSEGLVDDIDMKIILPLIGKELGHYNANDINEKDLKALITTKVRQGGYQFEHLANIKKTRGGELKMDENAKQNIETLKTQVLASYIESKKGEAAMAKMQYDLAKENAEKADDHERWSRKTSTVSLGISVCSIVSGVCLGAINTALAIYIASQQ